MTPEKQAVVKALHNLRRVLLRWIQTELHTANKDPDYDRRAEAASMSDAYENVIDEIGKRIKKVRKETKT